MVLSWIMEAFHLIQPASADDPDPCFVCLHARGDYSEGEKVGKPIFCLMARRSLATKPDPGWRGACVPHVRARRKTGPLALIEWRVWR